MVESLTLHLREHQLSIGWLLTCFTCLILIAVASLRQERLISLIFLGYYKIQKEDSFNNDAERMGLSTFVILTLNYLLAASLALSLLMLSKDFDTKSSLMVVFIPIIIVLYWKAGQWLIFAMVGKHPIIKQLKYHLRFAICTGGFFFLSSAIIISLNKSLVEITLFLLFIGFLLMYLNRIYKGVIASILMGIRWYYILLYLCTVEVLPLVAFFLFYYDKTATFVK